MAFLVLSNRFKKDRKIGVVGAYVYIFSGYCLTVGFMHPYFINAMILLPLLIVSLDKLMTDEKCMSFVVMVFLTITVNFYFAYMILLMGFIYALVTIGINVENMGTRKSAKIFLRGIRSLFLGVFLSAYVLIPILIAYSDSYRSQGMKKYIPMVSDIGELKFFLMNMFRVPDLKSGIFLGISVLVFVAIYSSVINKNKKMLYLFFVGLCIVVSPKLQSIMNGFSYPTYRWAFGIDLLLSYMFVDQFENMVEMNKKQWLTLTVIGSIYIFIVLKYESEGMVITMTLLAVYILLLGIVGKRHKKIVIMVLSIVMVSVNIIDYATNLPTKKYLVDKEYIKTVDDDYILKDIGLKTKNTLARLENASIQDANFAEIYSYPSVSGYYSIESGNYSRFNRYYENSKASPLNSVSGMDSRAIIDGILSVKYHYGCDNMPFGFEDMGGGWIHKNTNYIPFGFTYDRYVYKEDIDRMSAIDRQAFLMGACLLEEKIDGIARLVNIDQYLIDRKGIELKKSPYKRQNKKDGLVLSTDINIPFEGELYAVFDGVGVFGINDRFTSRVVEKIKTEEKSNMNTRNKKNSKDGLSDKSKFNLQGGKVSTSIVTGKDSKWYSGEEHITHNLGNVRHGDYDVSYKLAHDGKFDMSKIKYYLVSTRHIEKDSQKLSEDHLYDLKIDGDKISGKINNEKDKLLFMSIPYSRGYEIRINDIKTKVYRANIGFMAVKLPSGSNNISIDYHRPGQKIGYLVSLLGIVMCIGFAIRDRKKCS